MISIDLKGGKVTTDSDGKVTEMPIGSPEAFRLLSEVWIRSGWDAKYVYSFSWMGRPIIQLPEDIIRVQELLWSVAPDVIIETGVAHGGSLVLYAGICHALGKGKVIGVDIEIRPPNRAAIMEHPLASYITLIEGNSVAPATAEQVRRHLPPNATVFVMLDSNHSKEHVLAELEAYGPLVSVGSFIVAADGIMGEIAGAPRTKPDWAWNNPAAAAKDFVERHPAFAIQEPRFPFNEGAIEERVTYWPSGIIRRVRT